MKNIFKPGDKKEYRKTVLAADLAAFHDQLVHPVCSTFSLARDFEWTSRLFAIDMKEGHEEGIGTFLSVEHKAPAWEGDEIVFTATLIKLHLQELTCAITASVGAKIIAKGTTGQKIMKRENLKEIFRKL